MRREYVTVAAIWLVLTAIGEAFAILVDFYPVARSDKGEEIESAFRVLVYFSVPVFMFVVAVICYSVFKYRTTALPDEDGPPLQGRGWVPLSWLAVTAALAVAVMIYPGLVGIPAIFGSDDNPDILVEVEGVQWTWFVTYPEQDVTRATELVLPVDRSVRFEISSADVLHSFFIPAFLMKIDAVPGRITTISLTPTKMGSFSTDPNLRLQCAELCGLLHSRMTIPVSVVSDEEFEAWVREQQEAAEPGPGGETPVAPDAQQVTVVGKNIQFDVTEIGVESGRQVAITFDNQDEAVPHNWALYESEEAANTGVEAIATSPIENGLIVQEIVFDAPDAGTYFYRCDVHPTIMIGSMTVE